jgi:hypothetical protein
MTEAGRSRNPKVGKLRPSQVVTQHGPGAVVDLPELSVIMGGTNHWWVSGTDRVFEPRLEAFLHVGALYRPPQPEPGKFGGLPSYVFPEWLVCPRCRYLAPFKNFYFRRSGEFICGRDDTRHRGRGPAAFPARFMVACAAGHLDDFPWAEWAHGGDSSCAGPLELADTGSSGSASDLIVKCTRCGKDKPLGDAFQKHAISGCTGRRPWLSPAHYEAGCSQSVKTILRGASNAYFPVVSSALSIPPWSDPIQQELAPYREKLEQAKSLDQLGQGIELGFYDAGDLLQRYTVEQLWRALRAEPGEQDLKQPEYIAFLHPETRPEAGAEFEISPSRVHDRYSDYFSSVVAASRLREVRALRGFTRIDSVPDLGERTDVSELEIRIAPLGLDDVYWLPGIDLRGEGIFLQLSPATLSQWEEREAVRLEGARLAGQFSEWRASRSMDERPFPGMRYVLLHTLAHVLIRQFALDCGYSSSALRERIYSSTDSDGMAGLLIYTASADSDGSLGGLVAQAAPDRLAPLLANALHESAFCASDPLCGSGDIRAATNLNGAACHACLLLAETSCEFGNRLLDRATLVDTLGQRETAFFETT